MQRHHRPHPRNSDCTDIEAAFHARWIMNNDLTHIESVEEKSHIPYLIWYPHVADGGTYEELARRRPDMASQAARACMVAGYKEEYRRINPTPDYVLVDAARQKADADGDPFYHEDILRRAREMGIDVSKPPHLDERFKVLDEWGLRRRPWMPPMEVSPDWVLGCQWDPDWSHEYNGIGCNMGSLELFVHLPEELKRGGYGYSVYLTDMYQKACRRGN
jgi:hypothetical protein